MEEYFHTRLSEKELLPDTGIAPKLRLSQSSMCFRASSDSAPLRPNKCLRRSTGTRTATFRSGSSNSSSSASEIREFNPNISCRSSIGRKFDNLCWPALEQQTGKCPSRNLSFIAPSQTCRAADMVRKFEEMDADKSGKLSREEAVEGLRAMKTTAGQVPRAPCFVHM